MFKYYFKSSTCYVSFSLVNRGQIQLGSFFSSLYCSVTKFFFFGLAQVSQPKGPLSIWTEHSNCQIHSRGDSKTLIALLRPNIFLNFFYEIIFLWPNLIYIFVENSVNSELCFFWDYSNQSIWNWFKNAHVWAA